MKLLIVSNDRAFKFSLSCALKILEPEIECITTLHEEALEKFLIEDYDTFLINDYSEKGDPNKYKWAKGTQTYRDIKASAQPEQRIFRCGFDSYDHEDYIKAPFDLTELIKKLQGG